MSDVEVVEEVTDESIAVMGDDDLSKALAEAEDAQVPEDDGTEQAESSESDEADETTAESDNGDADADESNEPTLEELRAQLEQANAEARKKQLAIDRLGNEVGELRKLQQLSAQQQQTEAQSEEDVDYYNDPKGAIRQELSRAQKEEAVRQQQMEVQRNLAVQQNKAFIEEQVPDFEDMIDDVMDIIKSDLGDRATPAVLNAVKSNIYSENPGIVLGFAKRVQDRRELARLQNEFEEFKKKQNGVLDKIGKAGKSRGLVNGKSGQASKGADIDLNNVDPSKLSDEELDEILKRKFQ